MIPFIEQAQCYAASHQHPVSRYTHMVGIPLLLLSGMILLGFIHIVIIGVCSLNLAYLVTLGLIGHYARLNWRLALILTPLLLLLLLVAHFFTDKGPTCFAIWSFVILLVLGAGLQLVGILVEGKRPATTEILWQTLIAPLCLVAEVAFLFGQLPDLHVAIHGKH